MPRSKLSLAAKPRTASALTGWPRLPCASPIRNSPLPAARSLASAAQDQSEPRGLACSGVDLRLPRPSRRLSHRNPLDRVLNLVVNS